MSTETTNEGEALPPVAGCVSLPITPGLAQLLENAAQIARGGGDNYVRIHHVEAALEKIPTPPPVPTVSRTLVRRRLITTKPCPKCGEQLRKFQRHKATCRGSHNR